MTVWAGIQEKKVFSQNGEDGVIESIVTRLYGGTERKSFVEIGVQCGSECNTRYLREQHRWQGVMFDDGFEDASINLHKEFITPNNVTRLFERHHVKRHTQLLSIDVDGIDWYILREILKSYTWDVIVVEYNGAHPWNSDKVVLYDPDFYWDGTNYYGASLKAFHTLLSRYGYSLVYCENRGANAFFVNDAVNFKIDNKNCLESLYKKPTYGSGPNGSHPADPRKRRYLTSVSLLATDA